jgi:NAD(P)-dependent dehydrogenase (short-subunit alcohol dehydrogenase family)
MVEKANMSGKVALVTGAASGLGRATAIAFAELRASLCLVDLNAAGLAETASLLGDADALVHAADLSDPPACPQAVAATVARFGRLDALCNVAGLIYFANTPQMPLDLYRRTIASTSMRPS